MYSAIEVETGVIQNRLVAIEIAPDLAGKASIVFAENGSSGSQADRRHPRGNQSIPLARQPLGGLLGGPQAKEGASRGGHCHSCVHARLIFGAALGS